MRILYIKTCKSKHTEGRRYSEGGYKLLDNGYKSEDTGGRILVRGHWREDTKHLIKDIRVNILEAGYQLFKAFWKGGNCIVENGYKSERQEAGYW